MSTRVIRVNVPASVAAPRGARWAAGLIVWLERLGRSTWSALERAGHRRAASELRRLAAYYELSNPALAAQLLEASRFNPA